LGEVRFGIADCGLRIADCGLRIADCGLRIADCGLRIADCGLRIADCGLRIFGETLLITMNAEELKQRTKAFGLRILKLVDALPQTHSGRVISGQLGRSGTSVGANYRAACRARSRSEFIAKLGIVEEEADECVYWLELAAESGSVPARRVTALHREANELTAIVVASIRSARSGKSPAPQRERPVSR
jgi:four helix bundle protein